MMTCPPRRSKPRRWFGLIQLLVTGVLWTLVAGAGDEHDGAKTAAAAPAPEPGAVGSEFRSPATQLDSLLSTNLIHPQPKPKAAQPAKNYQQELDAARQLRRSKDNSAAAKLLVTLLENELPAEFKRAALFELAMVAQDAGQLARAQQILAQYLQIFPQDPTVPEVLLRQGLIYRQMGASQMAVAKFYAVMNTALSMKLDQFDYYKRLVLQAQTEIADTYYLQGKFPEASDFFGRILKQKTVDLNRSQIHFKLVRCLSSLGRHADVVTQCEDFFRTHPDAAEVPELRFVCASSLKQLGRGRDALLQVMKLLQSQQETARINPENWSYWQQRAGNEIANQLYLEGDYLNALDIYNSLAELNTAPAWQLPVWYQVGIIYERLQQPKKASEKYDAIAAREKELTASAETPNLKTVIELAKWRKEHIQWHDRAEVAVQSLKLRPVSSTPTNAAPANKP
jgi:tetratricopeptide (TPR) repeat protein